MRWHPRIRRVALFTLLGLGTTASLSFIAPLMIRKDEMTSRLSRENAGAFRIYSPFWSRKSIDTVSPGETVLDSLARRRNEVYGLTFAYTGMITYHWSYAPTHSWHFTESGWPFAAFWGWSKSDLLSPMAPHETGGLVKVRMLRSENKKIDYIDLPYLPDWGGLAANTALFSLAWWGVIAGSGALRRGFRRRRGRCPACGYDLHGLSTEHKGKCPECGSPSP